MHIVKPLTAVGDPNDGIEVLACLSDDPATDSAHVFVHGFFGDHDPRRSARQLRTGRGGGTWRGFHDAVLRDPRFARSDVYFVGYRSVLTDTHSNAARLLAFLHQQLAHGYHPDGTRHLRYVNDPSQRFADASVRVDPLPYGKLTLVAHSEGGVVCRKAIVRASRDPRPGPIAAVNRLVLDGDLVLFASAHGGTRASGLADLAGDVPFLGWLSKGARAASPAYQDMTSESIGLDQLRADTEGLAADAVARSGRSLWAVSDRVVEAVDYATDAPSAFLRKSDHVTVCKPDEDRRNAVLAFLFAEPMPAATVLGPT